MNPAYPGDTGRGSLELLKEQTGLIIRGKRFPISGEGPMNVRDLRVINIVQPGEPILSFAMLSYNVEWAFQLE